MVIQRWQSLLLFIAVIFTAVFCFTPFAILGEAETLTLTPAAVPAYLILNITTAVLLFVTIFLFKNLRLQMRIAAVCVALLLCSIVLGLVLVFDSFEGAQIVWTGGLILLVVALVLTIQARRMMKKDYNLLRSYDRMR